MPITRHRVVTLRYPFNGDYPVIFRFGELPSDERIKKKYIEWNIKGHNGIDFGLPIGTEVIATDSGKVILLGEHGEYGISVMLQHAWGSSLYAHLEESRVSVDEQISIGQIIGLSGQTGFATGPHLHFAVMPLKPDLNNGYLGYINPATFFPVDPKEKLEKLKEKLVYYENKLAFRMKRYRGVIHESGVSEMKHNEVMVLKAIVADLRREIAQLTN